MSEIPKNILVFLPASLFKVLAASIIVLFFQPLAFAIIFAYSMVLSICLICTYSRLLVRPMAESLIMSWLTITNLGRGKDDALCRLVSTLYWNIAHTITFTVILVICNTDPSNVSIFSKVSWSELALVQDLPILNALLISTICLGWLSLVADVITAFVRYHYYLSY